VQKKLNWLHLSDIHFSRNTMWRDEVYRTSLLRYLRGLFSEDGSLKPQLIFCTGDIAFGEATSDPLVDQYSAAKAFFDELLIICGDDNKPLEKERLFVVPGNHDINRKRINGDAQAALQNFSGNARDFAQKINQRFNDKSTEFCDAIRRLDEYANFVKEYLPHQCDPEGRHHYAKTTLVDGIKVGIAGFNSAWTCAGAEDDRNIWLAANWQFNESKKLLAGADIRIGLIHHPVDWLNIADRELAAVRVASDFDFWLHGHAHNAWVTPVQSYTVIAAGAVGAQSSDEFGVNITSINFGDASAVSHLHSVKVGNSDWTITPIAGHAPSGKWRFPLPTQLAQRFAASEQVDQVGDGMAIKPQKSPDGFVLRYFSRRLDDALRAFSTHSNSWVSRTVSTTSELAADAEAAPKVGLVEFISNPISAVIKAPAQYGLTCLAHYLIKEAWKKTESTFFLYLDAKDIAANKASVDQAIADELQILGQDEGAVACVVLDSWTTDEKEMLKLLKVVSERFKDKPLLVMQQINSVNYAISEIKIEAREFSTYYLWSLTRNVMRNIVASYNETRPIGDEDAVTSRLASDLDVLNLHRTPINCITLLKVSEFDFDESPVNRSELIKRVLFLLFNIDAIPTYKSRPDLKDCEYVLGRFCEILIREDSYIFSRDKFLLDVQKFCRDNLIDLETHLVFDVLYHNNIIVRIGNFFRFRFSYWIFYFAAQHMHHDEEFARYVFEDMRYTRYPEIIEFYTGIDRRRNDALQILTRDIARIHNDVKQSCGLPEGVNPYRFAMWTASPAIRSEMEKEIADGVLGSNLPAAIKDRYADRSYNKARPYNQNISDVLNEHSFLNMMRAMSAGARALRNSDYASPEIKKDLLKEILNCWVQATKVMFIVLPILAKEGYAAYDGMGFILGDGFGADIEERFTSVLKCIPSNVVSWGKEDLYSRKMAPLLIDHFNKPDIGELEKHELVLLMIDKRPRGWEKCVERYIANNAKNSYYLMDVYQALRVQYRLSFANAQTLKTIEFLIKMTATKHITGEKQPTEKSFKKVRLASDVIPTRELALAEKADGNT
jgi:predicted MPP superfamily phosphohydrolase